MAYGGDEPGVCPRCSSRGPISAGCTLLTLTFGMCLSLT